MAPPQLAGEARFALLAALPAATTSGTLILCIRLIAFCITAGQVPESHASDRLTTLAGFVFRGTPGMGMPADHITPSAMSETYPRPSAPRTRACWIFASGATPAMPILLFVCAAAMPATCEPCHQDGRPGLQSPWSCGFASRPLPSREW